MLVTQGGRFGGGPHLHSTARAASAGGRTSVLKVDGKVVASEKMDLMDRTVRQRCSETSFLLDHSIIDQSLGPLAALLWKS
jgi:hypothetical protein